MLGLCAVVALSGGEGLDGPTRRICWAWWRERRTGRDFGPSHAGNSLRTEHEEIRLCDGLRAAYGRSQGLVGWQPGQGWCGRCAFRGLSDAEQQQQSINKQRVGAPDTASSRRDCVLGQDGVSARGRQTISLSTSLARAGLGRAFCLDERERESWWMRVRAGLTLRLCPGGGRMGRSEASVHGSPGRPLTSATSGCLPMRHRTCPCSPTFTITSQPYVACMLPLPHAVRGCN